MIENPYKRNAPVPKKAKVTIFPRMCSLRTIIVGILLLLAILTWYLHVRGDYMTGDAKGIPAGKLRGKGKVDSLESVKRNGIQKQEESEEEEVSEEPIINKWKELAKLKPSVKPSVKPSLKPSSKPSVSPTMVPTVHHRQILPEKKKSQSTSNSGVASAELEQIREKEHSSLLEEHAVVTQPPIQVQRTIPREEQPVKKQHDDDDVKEEEGESPQQSVKLVAGKAKKTINAVDRVDRTTPPVARVTPHVVMRTGYITFKYILPSHPTPLHTHSYSPSNILSNHSLAVDSKTAVTDKEQREQRPVTLVVGKQDKSSKKTLTHASIEQSEEQINVQKGEEKVVENEEQKKEEEKAEAQEDKGQDRENAQTNMVRGQVQQQQPDAEETELHDALQADRTESLAQQEEARKEVIRPKIVTPVEDQQQQEQQQQQQQQQQQPDEEQEALRQRRDSALKHAMLREEQKVTVTDKTPATDTTTTSSSSSSSSKTQKTPNPPTTANKNSAQKTVATKVSTNKAGKKTKSVTSKYQKPKQQPMVQSPKKKTTNGNQLDTPESRKLAAANAAAAAAGTISNNTNNNNTRHILTITIPITELINTCLIFL